MGFFILDPGCFFASFRVDFAVSWLKFLPSFRVWEKGLLCGTFFATIVEDCHTPSTFTRRSPYAVISHNDSLLSLSLSSKTYLKMSASIFSLVALTASLAPQALVPCASVVLVSLTVDLPAKALVSLFTPRLPLSPVPLLFSAETDAENWVNHISAGEWRVKGDEGTPVRSCVTSRFYSPAACVQFRGVEDCPSHGAVWAVSALGFVFFHDTEASEREVGGARGERKRRRRSFGGS